MRQAAVGALLMFAAACGGAPMPQAPDGDASSDTPLPDASSNASGISDEDSGGIGTASDLTGSTSALTGTVSDFATERTDFGTRVQLSADTLFEFDKAVLTPAAETNLRRTADLVRQGGRGTVTVIGHTDSKGDEAYNLDLSKRRAAAVASWLQAQSGMEARTFAVEGRGEAEPVAPNTGPDGSDDPEGRARNRRVTVDIPE